MDSNYFVNPYGYNTIKANSTGWELPLHLLFFFSFVGGGSALLAHL